jgi:hypothetical protein
MTKIKLEGFWHQKLTWLTMIDHLYNYTKLYRGCKKVLNTFVTGHIKKMYKIIVVYTNTWYIWLIFFVGPSEARATAEQHSRPLLLVISLLLFFFLPPLLKSFNTWTGVAGVFKVNCIIWHNVFGPTWTTHYTHVNMYSCLYTIVHLPGLSKG